MVSYDGTLAKPCGADGEMSRSAVQGAWSRVLGIPSCNLMRRMDRCDETLPEPGDEGIEVCGDPGQAMWRGRREGERERERERERAFKNLTPVNVLPLVLPASWLIYAAV
jgi:hypothetical protein